MGEHEQAAASRWPWLVGAAVAVVLLGAAGAFGGNWLWAKHLEREAQAAKEATDKRVAAERATPKWLQQQVVRQQMNDPDAAQFRNERAAKRGEGVWCGEVNGRNRMGGMVGFRRYVALMEINDKLMALPEDERVRLAAMLTTIRIDPADYSKPDLQKSFDGAWSTYCE